MANKKPRKLHGFTFQPFSKKQLRVLNWWAEDSPVRNRKMMIADGSIRAGKTVAITLSFVIYVMKHFDYQNAAIAGKSVGAVRRNVLANLQSMLLAMGYEWVEHRSENYIEIIKGEVVNNFYLFGLKDATSSGHIQGLTLCSCFIDEAVVADKDGFNQLIGRCSVDGSKIWVSCNPESPYHWFYTQFIKQAEQKNILYIHFTMDDNPSLSDQIKEDYKKMFSGVWAKRFIEGKWAVANGLVYDMFEDNLNIVKDSQIPYHEIEKWTIGVDYGTGNATAFLLLGKATNGIIYAVDEYFFAGRREAQEQGDYEAQKTDLEYAEDMKVFIEDHRGITGKSYREIEIMTDPAANSFILQMRRMKMRSKKANNDVIDGIRTVASYIGSERLKISENCKNLIKEIHTYSWDEKAQARGVDQVVKTNDHSCDALRYGLMKLKDKNNIEKAAKNVGWW